MAKRILATLFALMLALGTVCGALAEEPLDKFSPAFVDGLSAFDSPETAVSAENRKFVAATMYLEYLLHQSKISGPIETDVLWKDCVVTRMNNIVMAGFDLGQSMLIVFYDTHAIEMMGKVYSIPFAVADTALPEIGSSTVYTVEGSEWTETLQMLLEVISGSGE